jgi:activator of HSP90 ATPase
MAAKHKTRPDWNDRKKEVYKFIKNNSGKYNGVEICFKLNVSGINELKLVKGHYIGYFSELEKEGKIKYDYKAEKWHINARS